MKKINSREVVLIILFAVATLLAVYYHNKCVDLDNTIEIKNNRIQELLTENTNCKMARDESYELFMSCIYPHDKPDFSEDSND